MQFDSSRSYQLRLEPTIQELSDPRRLQPVLTASNHSRASLYSQNTRARTRYLEARLSAATHSLRSALSSPEKATSDCGGQNELWPDRFQPAFGKPGQHANRRLC